MINCPEIGLFTESNTFAVPADTKMILTSGYSDPGLGAARYAAISGTSSAPYGFQIGSQWYELAEPEPTVEMFGAIGNGSTDDTAAIQSAANFAAARSLPLLLAKGRYLVSSVTIPSNLVLWGSGTRLSVIVSSSIPGNIAVLYGNVGVGNVKLSNFSIDGQSLSDTRPLLTFFEAGNNLSIEKVSFLNGMAREVISVYYNTASTGFTLVACEFDNIPDGGIVMSADPGIGVENIRVSDSVWNGWGTNGFQMNNNGATTYDTYIDVRVTGNTMLNPLSAGANGPIPFEHWGCTNYVASNNVIDGGTRGLTAGACMKNGVISNNVVRNQSLYFAEAGVPCQNVLVSGNYAQNCAGGIAWTAEGIVSNYVIENNIFDGTGNKQYNSGNPSSIFKNYTAGQSENLFYDILIRNNLITKAEYCRSIADLRISDTDNQCYVDFSSNTVLFNDPDSPQSGLNILGYRVEIKDNIFRRLVDLDGSTHFQGSISAAMIALPNQTAGASIAIERNRCENLGTVSNDNICAIGNFSAGTQPFPGVTVANNSVSGNFGPNGYGIVIQSTAGDTIVRGNDVIGVTQGTKISLNSSIKYREDANKFTGSASPTSGNWLTGDIVFNVNPSAGDFAGWICTGGGSPGTWKTFGAISA